ncbi:tyrosine-type recombinase/integrase [Streptomyces sp. NBC_01320]|uniref:tyrosine-type recombinase/integrase n=1 Tax=Streptomyces sp. NBC_01320 TaxID=2903824 RepID=UPI002E0E3A69|nr:tyrosine-type recombinase/integrase [Streptomyces sp. NBC_01320]WSK01157.1 tyrosine-type recombinase/integrase [Streptomyces sp. NBC_01320]
MRVVKERDGGVVRRVRLVDGDGELVAAACRFLDHLVDRGFSPHTICAYAYDLRRLFTFLAAEGMDWREFRSPDALRLLASLRRAPSRRPAQRLGLTVVVGGPEAPGSLLAPATVNRILAAVSSFYDWAVVAEEYDGDSPMQKRLDPALARVPDRHQPFMGRASRQQPMRRTVTVKQPRRLPRPVDEAVLEQFIGSLKRLRDLAVFLLMLDGGLRPGEVLSLHLDDISYGRRRVTVRKRDDHPRGVRGKSRTERVVDLHEPRTLDAVSRYVMHERPLDATSPFVFLVGGKGTRRLEPLGYDAVVRLFARRLDKLGLRTPETTPHALRHTHATAMWEGGMRELSLQKRLGHASPESTKVYTRVSDEAVLADYTRALESNR